MRGQIMRLITFLAVCIMAYCAPARADVEVTDIVAQIGAVYATPADIPPSNVPLVTPGCTYEPTIRFTIELTKPNNGPRQTFLYWLHPDTKAYDVISQWLANFQSLDGSSFLGIDWANASGALHRLEGLLHGSSIPYWRMYTDPESLSADVLAQLVRLRDAGMQLPCLQMSNDGRTTMLNFFNTSRFLDLFGQGGLGNLTMEEFYHSPADPATVSNSQIDLVVNAIEFGFFRQNAVVECDSTVVMSALHAQANAQSGADVRFAVNNTCCNKATRVCVSYVGLNCVMCSSFCCLGGVNWCP